MSRRAICTTAAIVREYGGDPRIKLGALEKSRVGGWSVGGSSRGNRALPVRADSDDQLVPDFCAEVSRLPDDETSVDAYRFIDEGLNLRIGYLRSIRIKKRTRPAV